jgi:hypothetical protein
MSAQDSARITKINFLWMSLSSEPFVALYALLPFILAKDLKASALQISLFMAIKPILSVFSYYWHAFIHTKHPNLRKHLMVAWGLSFIPFLLYPPLKHLWFVVLAASCYQLFSKAAMPPFYEICKQNLEPQERKKLISNTYLASFLVSALLGLFFGQVLDKNPGNWKIASALFALLALTSLYIQKKLPFEPKAVSIDTQPKSFIGPLKESFAILKSSKEFKNFQIGFMIGGSALMFIGPALSIYYADTLDLSHKTYTQARYIFMSLGIICSTPLWKKAATHFSLNKLIPWISAIFGLFPLIVIMSYMHKPILNSAFMCYGIAQAGSHLVWNLSGSVFSKDQDSNPYTALNILMQGLRGCFAPVLGGFLTYLFGPLMVLILGSILAFFGMYVMLKKNKEVSLN